MTLGHLWLEITADSSPRHIMKRPMQTWAPSCVAFCLAWIQCLVLPTNPACFQLPITVYYGLPNDLCACWPLLKFYQVPAWKNHKSYVTGGGRWEGSTVEGNRP